jgi:hypothetical protein
VRTYKVADPRAADGERTRVIGTIFPARRQPTPDEIRKINESLSAMGKPAGAPAAPNVEVAKPAAARSEAVKPVAAAPKPAPQPANGSG